MVPGRMSVRSIGIAAALRGFLCLAALTCSFGASAQALWEGSRDGMSRAQVSELMPSAYLPKQPDELAGGELEGLRIDKVEVAGLPFGASFFFAHDALSQVTLSLDVSTARTERIRAFEHMAARLQLEHGSAQVSEAMDDPFFQRNLKWHIDGAWLNLFYAEFGQQPVLKLIHQVHPPRAPPGPRLLTH